MVWKKYLTADEAANIATGNSHCSEEIDPLKLLGNKTSPEQISAIATYKEKASLKRELEKEIRIAELNEHGMGLEKSCLVLKKVPLIKSPDELLSRPPRTATRASYAQWLNESGAPGAANRVLGAKYPS